MLESNDREFFALITGLAEVLGETMSEGRITGYFNALKSHDMADVKRAINQAAVECRFFPKPVELIEMIEGSRDSKAARAWQMIAEAAQTGGQYNSVFVEEMALAVAMRRTFGDWVTFVNELPPATDPMNASLFNRFRAAYTAASRSGETADRYFVGWFEGQNRSNCSNWTQPAESQNYGQKVTVISRGRVFESLMDFSRLTGALTDGARKQLTEGKAQPARIIATALPEARMVEGEVEPKQILSQIRQLSAGSNRPS